MPKVKQDIEKPDQKKESVLFMGSGVVFLSKKDKIKFNKNYLFETDDPKIIKILRDRKYPETSEESVRTLMASGNYEASVRNILRGGTSPKKTKGALSQDEVDKMIGR